jgi:hypothetical protein
MEIKAVCQRDSNTSNGTWYFYLVAKSATSAENAVEKLTVSIME